MIVVVASSCDDTAKAIVAHWGARCATLLTERDLCQPGWSLTVPFSSSCTAMIAGQILPVKDVTGVLTLRPWIYAEELLNIVISDRSYVSAELNAFLFAWLEAISNLCPVINRPVAPCLAGPNWRAEQWTQVAARLGIPVQARHRYVPCQDSGRLQQDTAEVTIIGRQCFGDNSPTLRDWTLELAHASGTDLLSARFSRETGCFVSATPWPDLASDDVLATLKQQLEGKI